MKWIVPLAIVVVLFVLWVIAARNRIKLLEVKVEEAKSGVDLALAKRYDILTESLNVVKGYAVHEKDLLIQLTEVRAGMTVQQLEQVMENHQETVEKLKLLAEAYPQLYSNELFQRLQQQIAETNEHVNAAKRLFNSNIALYNQKNCSFSLQSGG